jgi:phenylpropionate dioxygenase-like ring-hydroxylating dioxygenase large terminal subunit
MADIVTGEKGAFSDSASDSYTLPSRYYVDPEILAKENTNIFQRSWLYAGHITDVPDTGSYMTDELAGQPILILRSEDGDVRAFFNVCQHRGHILLSGKGQLKKRIICPYHAWCYGLDGALKTARLTTDVPNFNNTEFSLKPIQLSVVAGLIFVNFDLEATPEDGDLMDFEKSILGNLPEMPRFTARHRFDFDIAANWKVVVDNFSEGYHIPVAHPHLATLYNGDGGSSHVGKRFSFYGKSARAGFSGFETTGEEPYLTWFLWPNLCLLSLPGSPQLIVVRMGPGDIPGRCIERADIYCPPELQSDELEAVKSLFAEMFNREDIALVESVQRGLSSLGYDQGRYVADRDESWFSESALHRFHHLILDSLTDEV